jgi:hypothetical protein
MSTVKSKKLQVGTDATSSNNFTIYQPATPDGTLRVGVGNADSPTEVGRFNSNGYVATNAPAFSAKAAVDQFFSTSTWTKVVLETEEFDTDNCFDNATNYRFTPTVAGYYNFQAHIRINYTSTAGDAIYVAVYKNGSEVGRASRLNMTGNWGVLPVSTMCYMNGSTDYVELYVQSNHTSSYVDYYWGQSNSGSKFQGYLVRAV